MKQPYPTSSRPSRLAVAAAVATAIALPTWLGAPAGALVLAGPRAGLASAGGHSGDRFTMASPFARQVTRYGDQDTSVHHIEHVRELQYRLIWAGQYSGHPTGVFGTKTRAAVRRYQRAEGLEITGVATHKTWRDLIHDTIRRRGAIKHVCRTKGWHACYDRSAHQVTLWHSGTMRNSWLVRGGGSSTPTRTGTYSVFLRDIDHVSSLFDAPMPYAQFFDGGQALHGSVYMIDPFVDHSHGCVNFYLKDARQLWRLTSHHRLSVTVYGAWD